MTCSSCEEKVMEALSSLPAIQQVEVLRDQEKVLITADRVLNTEELQSHLPSKYSISALDQENEKKSHDPLEGEPTSYFPLVLILIYLLFLTLLVQWQSKNWDFMEWMRHFMAGFFLVFSFFKFLDIKGFSSSYRMYDIVAKNWKPWGFIYPFVELIFGIGYWINFEIKWLTLATTVVMTVSLIGVLESVFNKRKIKCACLGTVFNLPMSTVTIIEDSTMILMSAWMFLQALS